MPIVQFVVGYRAFSLVRKFFIEYLSLTIHFARKETNFQEWCLKKFEELVEGKDNQYNVIVKEAYNFLLKETEYAISVCPKKTIVQYRKTKQFSILALDDLKKIGNF